HLVLLNPRIRNREGIVPIHARKDEVTFLAFSEKFIPLRVVSVPVGLVISFIPFRDGTAHTKLLVRTPEQRPTSFHQLFSLQSGERIDRLLPFCIQQLWIGANLFEFMFDLNVLWPFWFVLLTALDINSRREDHIDDLVDFRVLERLEELSNLMDCGRIIRLLFD